MRWYNPKTRSVEVTSAPSTDEETSENLRGHLSSSTINNPAGYPSPDLPSVTATLLLPHASAIAPAGSDFPAIIRVTDGARTRDLLGATIRRHRLPRVATGCKIGLSKPISLLAVARRCCALRPGWCQEWCQNHHRVVFARGALRRIRAALLSPSKPGVDVYFSSSPLTLL